MARRSEEDRRLRERALRVIPGGMYGHQSTRALPPEFPQYFDRAQGARLWDVDGNPYLDYLCGYGPNLLGYRHPEVEHAARTQAAAGDCMSGPSPRMVELAERFCELVEHAEWVMFAKNGTDATTLCATIARAATGRRKLLCARGAYHGAAPWCTPIKQGVVAEDRAHVLRYEYNDVQDLEAAFARAGDDLAAVFATPFRHDVYRDQESVDVAFARRLRELCDERGALLVLDEVRAGLRMARGGSWEAIGVRPDLSAWSKAIANGYPIAAVAGSGVAREAAGRVYATGSFWFSAVAMAACLATLEVVRRDDVVAHIEKVGERLRAGLAAQARAHGYELRQTGPVQMPMLLFADDPELALGQRFTGELARRGVLFHPWHNMFLSAAHSEADIDRTLEQTALVFAALEQS